MRISITQHSGRKFTRIRWRPVKEAPETVGGHVTAGDVCSRAKWFCLHNKFGGEPGFKLLLEAKVRLGFANTMTLVSGRGAFLANLDPIATTIDRRFVPQPTHPIAQS